MSSGVPTVVLVVIGAGGIGEAIARRVGTGKRVLLADYDRNVLSKATEGMKLDGFDVHSQHVDVTSHNSVFELAQSAQRLGPVMHVALTAGLSPALSSREAILSVNLAGTAFVISEFEKVIAVGATCVMISSMAAYMLPMETSIDDIESLARTAPDDLLASPLLEQLVQDPWTAYGITKRVNQAQVQQACIPWAKRGARINSVSPGTVATPMLQQETQGEMGQIVLNMIQNTPVKRAGSSGEIANAVAFLLGPEASFVTGADLLVDGGSLAVARGNTSLEEEDEEE